MHFLREMAFQQAFEEMQRDAAEINKKNGFTAEEALIDAFEETLQHSAMLKSAFSALPEMFRSARAGLRLALIMGEAGEALEAVRTNKGLDNHIPPYTAEEAECADIVLRLMNYATSRELRLAEAIVAKNEFNRNRPDHTDRTGEHGKKF